jgi:hypothetical protein
MNSGAPQADAEILVSNNTFTNIRSIGRINVEDDFQSISFINNAFLVRDPATASNWIGASGTKDLRIFWGASAGITLNTLLFHGNYFSADWEVIQIAVSASSTLTSCTLTNNVLQCYGSSSGASFIFQNNACTITNARVIGNNTAGDISFPALATITTSFVSGNMTENTGGTWRLVRNTARKTVDVIGDLSTTVGSAGGASALPATPTGYVNVNIDGVERKIPYYAV